MEYFDKDELKRVLTVAYEKNRLLHMAYLVGLWHGARVTEIVELRGTDIQYGKITIVRKKRSLETCQALHYDKNPIFDESPIETLAKEKGTEVLFPYSRRWLTKALRGFCVEAEVSSNKAHTHAFKHSCAMLLWNKTGSLGLVQRHLGHKAASSTLCYLYESDKEKAEKAMASIKL
jgi:integrase